MVHDHVAGAQRHQDGLACGLGAYLAEDSSCVNFILVLKPPSPSVFCNLLNVAGQRISLDLVDSYKVKTSHANMLHQLLLDLHSRCMPLPSVTYKAGHGARTTVQSRELFSNSQILWTIHAFRITLLYSGLARLYGHLVRIVLIFILYADQISRSYLSVFHPRAPSAQPFPSRRFTRL